MHGDAELLLTQKHAPGPKSSQLLVRFPQNQILSYLKLINQVLYNQYSLRMQAQFPIKSHTSQSFLKIIILSQINSKAIYLCQYSLKVGKLSLVPSHPNGLPIKFNRFLLNDFLDSSSSINLKNKGFNIVTSRGYLEFINKAQIVSQPKNQVYPDLYQKFKYYLKRMSLSFIDQFVQSLLHLQSNKRNTPKHKKQWKHQINAYSNQLQTRRKICEVLKKNPKSASSPRYVDLQGQLEEFINFISKKQGTNKHCQPIKLGSNLNLISKIQVKEEKKIKKIVGGVSIIEQRNIEFMQYSKGLNTQKFTNKGQKMVIKKLRVYSSEQQKKKNIKRRFYRQPMLIHHLSFNGPKQYLSNYYFQPSGSEFSFYYIEFAEMNLTEFLCLYRSELGYSDLLDVCLDIVKIIQDLHSCGIVHRDIKPDNFVVSKPKISSKFLIKIIDFSDAFLISNIQFSSSTLPDEQQVCGTIPYSPIETERSNKNYYSHGLNKREIDLWSFGILLHIIMYGYQPLSFSRNFWKEINQLWMKDFIIHIRQKKGHNLSLIDETLQLIFVNLVRMNPEKRMVLSKVEKFLLLLKNYYNNLTITGRG